MLVKTCSLTSVWNVSLYCVGNSELSVNKKTVISAVAIVVVALVFATAIMNNDTPTSRKEIVREEK